MFAVPEKLKAVTHPRIASMYMQKDFGAFEKGEDVLVIDATFSEASDSYDDYLMEILLDLPALKTKAETSYGKIDRVDIRTH